MKIKNLFDKFRYSIQVKITLPYILLSVIGSLGAGLIITQLIVQSIDKRLIGSLIETGIASKELIVDQEDELLDSLRLISFLSGIDQLIVAEDSEGLREMVLPVVFNNSEDVVELLNTDGVSIISLRRDLTSVQLDYQSTKWGEHFKEEPVVQQILDGKIDQQGDKFAFLIELDGKDYFFVAGPLKNDNNSVIGVIMVGSLIQDMLDDIRKQTVAHVSTYDSDGDLIASTLLSPEELSPDLFNEISTKQNQESIIRDFTVQNISYREAISVWKLRGNLEAGLIGVSFSTTFLEETSQSTRWNVFGLVSTVLFVIIIIGIFIARMVTNPIQALKSAAIAVSGGDLDVRVDPVGNDEIALLTRSFNEMVTNIKGSKADLIEAYDLTLEGWSKALELRDEETEGHTQRVTEMTVVLAGLSGINGTDLENIRRGALLHDMGKVGVPDHILRKPGKLTEEEFDVIKLHPWYAYEMLSEISFLKPALDIPYCHHEKWDGSGYPEGLKGKKIPLAARIFSLVDVWDAITSDRPYRKAMPFEKALKIIEDGRGTHFDPKLTDLFLEYIKKVE